MTGAKLRLAAALALFLGWMGWLAYAAVNKDRGPVVSRAAAAAATHPVVAAVQADDAGAAADRVWVVEALRPGGPEKGAELAVPNLPAADGFDGPGKYLLLLVQDRAGGYAVAGRQRSPGYEGGGGKPVVYPWTSGVEAQARGLFR